MYSGRIDPKLCFNQYLIPLMDPASVLMILRDASYNPEEFGRGSPLMTGCSVLILARKASPSLEGLAIGSDLITTCFALIAAGSHLMGSGAEW